METVIQCCNTYSYEAIQVSSNNFFDQELSFHLKQTGHFQSKRDPLFDHSVSSTSLTKRPNLVATHQNKLRHGQWLWVSWQSGHFWHQRSAVQIPTSAIFLLNIVYCQLYWKYKNKGKEAGNGPYKNYIALSQFNVTNNFWNSISMVRTLK